jgi:negative regulator of sigma E activity
MTVKVRVHKIQNGSLLAACLLMFAQLPLAQAQDAKVELLQRFVAPPSLSYRAEIALDHGQQSVNRVLLVRDGRLSLNQSGTYPIAVAPQSDDLKTLLENYQAQWEDTAEQVIAQRPTKRVRFLPKDGWRYTRIYWLDQATGLPLKTETFRKNELIERMEVQSIEFVESNREREIQPKSASAFSVRNAPSGFHLNLAIVQQNRAQQVYSDGLAHVSVFVQAGGALPAEGFSQRGSTGFVVRRSGNVDMVAVGEVPQATLERFLSGVDVADQ